MIPETFRDIAKILGAPIEEDKYSEGRESKFVKMVLPWGGILLVEESRGRIEVLGSFPRSDGDYWGPHGVKYSISVSAEKSAEQIARDIERRLLPVYRVAYEVAVKRMNEYDEQAGRQRVLAKRLADVLGIQVSSHDPTQFHAYEPVHVEGRVNSEDVTLKITCSPELAERICGMIAGK